MSKCRSWVGSVQVAGAGELSWERVGDLAAQSTLPSRLGSPARRFRQPGVVASSAPVWTEPVAVRRGLCLEVAELALTSPSSTAHPRVLSGVEGSGASEGGAWWRLSGGKLEEPHPEASPGSCVCCPSVKPGGVVYEF